MENLKNVEILIGKEPGNGRLMLALNKDGQNRVTTLGVAYCVPNSVSRCRPGEGVAHCKILVDAEGRMTVVNLKLQNTTYVNGSEIASKRIGHDSRISLGKDQYPIDLNAVLDAAHGLLKQQNTFRQATPDKAKEYSIKPLKKVWDSYHDELFALQKRQKNQAMIKSLYLPCTVMSGMVGLGAKHIGLDEAVANALSPIMYVIAAMIAFYGVFMSLRDKSLEEREQITEKFQETYVCPNPECGHFMGNQPYNVLRKNTVCPYCRCKLTEK